MASEETFAGHLKNLRQAAGLNINQAVRACGLDDASPPLDKLAWQKMEDGEVFPSTNWVRPMALALGVEVHLLL